MLRGIWADEKCQNKHLFLNNMKGGVTSTVRLALDKDLLFSFN